MLLVLNRAIGNVFGKPNNEPILFHEITDEELIARINAQKLANAKRGGCFKELVSSNSTRR